MTLAVQPKERGTQILLRHYVIWSSVTLRTDLSTPDANVIHSSFNLVNIGLHVHKVGLWASHYALVKYSSPSSAVSPPMGH